MEHDAIVQTFQERLAAKVSPKGYYGFDPTIIIAIISAIMSALGGACPKPTPKQVKNKGILIRARTLSVVNQQFPDARRRDRMALADDVLDVGVESSEDEISAFLAACS